MKRNLKQFHYSGTKEGCTLSPYLFNIVVEISAIRQGKEMKGIQIGKEEYKVSLFIDDTIISRHSTRELLQLINTFSNGAGYKINSRRII